MPALPWTTIRTPDPARTYLGVRHHAATREAPLRPGLPPRHVAHPPPAAVGAGLVGYALLADLRHADVLDGVGVGGRGRRCGRSPAPNRIARSPAACRGRMGASVLRSFDVAGTDVPRAVAGREDSALVTDAAPSPTTTATWPSPPSPPPRTRSPATASPRRACARWPSAPASATPRSASASATRPACSPPSPPRGTACSASTWPAPARTCAALGRAYVEFAQQRPALFAVMFQPTVYRADDPGVRRRPGAHDARCCRPASGSATVDATADVALGAWAFVHGIASLVLGGAIEGDAVEVYDRVSVALFRGAVRRRSDDACRPRRYRSDPNDRPRPPPAR